MGFVPTTHCAFCSRRHEVMYLMPGAANTLACGECFRQVTFTPPRAAARVIRPGWQG
jgi:hypothetical protein